MRTKRAGTPIELLTTWGLIYAAGNLRDAIKRVGTGEESGMDAEQLAADYVCRTPGYFQALPVLRHVHVEYRHIRTFDPCLPWESLQDALERLEWPFLKGVDRHHVGPMMYDRFMQSLVEQVRATPFYYWTEVPDIVLPLRAKFA